MTASDGSGERPQSIETCTDDDVVRFRRALRRRQVSLDKLSKVEIFVGYVAFTVVGDANGTQVSAAMTFLDGVEFWMVLTPEGARRSWPTRVADPSMVGDVIEYAAQWAEVIASGNAALDRRRSRFGILRRRCVYDVRDPNFSI